ncbi:hypothetical protein CE143_15490 [Photorhabdus luminescens]|uniref:N-acetyltransferase domain-containing protein n=1 Tax=Photorhabdus akhurstii TaxID=171438 RepID=A0ABX8LV38_9GAMM|nr:hypothetical protein [Photorhabdus akhurstii]QXF34394.1 hypothetical protein B0X70_15495 [Photorhabdus akhurstii]UJD76221.1 hypothetical protein CE143_15490 [Photorhabdus luminescens]
MLSLEEIGQLVRNNLQLILDSQGLPLVVSSITDQDFKILAGGFGALEWEFGLTEYGNDPDRFEFCVKLVNTAIEVVPSGAALCLYGVNDKIFRIHMIESFSRNDKNHPLTGRMVFLTLMSAYLFSVAVEAEGVYIMEPVSELCDYYASFGFTMHECGYIMISDVNGLQAAFDKFVMTI